MLVLLVFLLILFILFVVGGIAISGHLLLIGAVVVAVVAGICWVTR